MIGEPRGSDVLVGALLCDPTRSDAAAAAIFFNNAGYLNMCGHGTIGVMVTLAHLNRISGGRHILETPVGIVHVELLDEHRVRFNNVSACRYRHSITLDVPESGRVTGDIAWGGNWFFLVSDHRRQLSPDRIPELLEFARAIRTTLQQAGITGRDGAEIDHIELTAASDSDADCLSFVLCPGGAWDRSPCGTGTSAKVACLAADGALNPGQVWRQQSLTGSVFQATWQPSPETVDGDPMIIPTITGSAWVTGSGELLLDPSDPFQHGIEI